MTDDAEAAARIRAELAHSPRLEVRVPADLHREITERAKRENVTVSKLVREILQRYIDEEAA